MSCATMQFFPGADPEQRYAVLTTDGSVLGRYVTLEAATVAHPGAVNMTGEGE